MKENTKKYMARAMIAWTVFGFGIQHHVAYAFNPHPSNQVSDQERASAVSNRRGDPSATARNINRRGERISKGWKSENPIRTPDLTTQAVGSALRKPNVTPSPTDEEMAKKAATRFPSLETEEIVGGAQRGSDFGSTLMGGAAIDSYNLETGKPNPDRSSGSNVTGLGQVNVREVIPSYTEQGVNDLREQGYSLYKNPNRLRIVAEQNDRNLRRNGCRKTDFVLLERQNTDSGIVDANHRVLLVEFYRLDKTPTGNKDKDGNDIMNISYERVDYGGWDLKLKFPTIGGVSSQWWEDLDSNHAAYYTYTPYTQPRGLNYFTYNHRLIVGGSGGSAVASEVVNAVISNGVPGDGFSTVIGSSVPNGVGSVAISADLYRTEVNYSEPAEGEACEPDPPASCEVNSIRGDLIRWCGGSPGAAVQLMYDDTIYKDEQKQSKSYVDDIISNANKKDYKSDGELTSGIVSGLNKAKNKVQELAGSCRRDSLSSEMVSFDNSYDVHDLQICTEALINPYPNGCNGIKRSFGLAKLADHNFLTVRAFEKKKLPVIDPATGSQAKDSNGNLIWTFTRTPTNVSGSIATNVSVFGAAQCPITPGVAGTCSTESAVDREEIYYEYDHTPMPADPKTHVVNKVSVLQGGSGNFSHYGAPAGGWQPVGSASGDGSYHQFRLVAEVHAVTINEFVGCKNYLEFAAEKICKGAALTCTQTSATKTVGTVTFGPGMPNSGVLDVLKKWGSENTQIFDDYDNGDSNDPTGDGAALVLLGDQMCWEANGSAFTGCNSAPNENNFMTEFMKGEQIWATDCDADRGGELGSLEENCQRAPIRDECDDRWIGVFTGVCYVPDVAYDCGERVEREVTTLVQEQADFCDGAIRCLGTECHRPNLTGSNMGDFAQAVSGMEALDMAKMDMVCLETSEPPTDTTTACTPIVFGGKPSFCKIPVGSGIGITPNCCQDAKDAAKDVDADWMMYLKGTYLMYQISQNNLVQQHLANSDMYNSTAKMFGEISQPITDAYKSAADFVTKPFVSPNGAGFDGILKSFGLGDGGGAATTPAVDATKEFAIGGVIDELKKKLMQYAYNFLKEGLGADFANLIFQTTSSTTADGVVEHTVTGELGALASGLALAIAIYAWAKLIGHLIFKCKEEEFQWGIDNKMRLCSYAGSCCAKKSALLGCIEKRQLYCCYRSIAARVIAEQIITKNLTGETPLMYRSPRWTGKRYKKCNINCGGFTAYELAMIDWAQVDLSEWADALIESGVLNTINPENDYGATSTSLPLTKAVGRHPDDFPELDQNVAALKTIEGMSQNIVALQDNTLLLKEEGHCYDSDSKMPYTMSECKEYADDFVDDGSDPWPGPGSTGNTGGGTPPTGSEECIESATLKCIYTGVGEQPGVSYHGNWVYPATGNVIYAYLFKTPDTFDEVGGNATATRATSALGKRIVLSKLAGDVSAAGKDNGCFNEGSEVASISYAINANKNPVHFCNLEPNTYYWVNVMPIPNAGGGPNCSGPSDCGFKASLTMGSWTPNNTTGGKPVIIVDQSGSDPAGTRLTIVPGCVNGGDVSWGSSCSTATEYHTVYDGKPFVAKMTAGQIMSIRYPISGTTKEGGTGVIKLSNPVGGGIGAETRISLSPIPGDMNGNNVDRCASQSTMNPSITTGTSGFVCVIDRAKSMYYLNIEVQGNCVGCYFYIDESSSEFN